MNIKLLSAFFVFISLLHSVKAQERMDEMWGDDKVNTQSQADSRIMDEGNYGMFIHWGMYSELANRYKGKTYYGIGEWLMQKGMANIPVKEYMELVSRFNPVDFDARSIARLAKEAGMSHVIVTSKHHDGFAMFDSKIDDFTIVKATPFKRDPLKELADACRAEGLGFGFYYSHNQDWTYPGGRNGPSVDAKGEKQTFDDYLENKCLPQVEELTTNYGKIDFMWFDTPGPMTKEQVKRVVAVVRKNQPKALISGRVGQGEGDYQTLGDMEVPHANATGLWESPDTSNDSWAYAWYDENWKTPKEILHRLISCVARGGTYLLNVGPDGKGRVPERNTRSLIAAGKWLKRYPQVIRAAGASPYGRALPWGDVTMQGTKMYLSVYQWPKGGKLHLYGLKTPVESAYVLGEKKTKISFSEKDGNGWMTFNVPIKMPDEQVSVIEVDLAGKVEVDSILWPVDSDVDTRLLTQFAEVENAEKKKRSWAEKFGEWKKAVHVTNWASGGKAYMDVNVQRPGDYMVYLDYRGKGRLVWEVSVEGGDSIRNQQGSSDYYQEFPIGWVHFPKAGKCRLSVSCLEGDIKEACLRAIRISPIVGL